MYYCSDCGLQFEAPKIILETHGLTCPPYEQFGVCPSCKSTSIHEKNLTHCRCCGARLSDNTLEYCSENCKAKGKKLWEAQIRKRRVDANSPINLILKELNLFNQTQEKPLSYGQYVSLKLQERMKKRAKRKEKASGKISNPRGKNSKT